MEKNNLNTFRILFLIKGGFSLFGSLFALMYLMFGMVAFDSFVDETQNIPFNPGLIFAIIGGIGFVFLVILGILDFMVAKRIKERKGYQFIFVMAIISCLTGMLGIALGIFTIIELNKPEVKALFDEKAKPLTL